MSPDGDDGSGSGGGGGGGRGGYGTFKKTPLTPLLTLQSLTSQRYSRGPAQLSLDEARDRARRVCDNWLDGVRTPADSSPHTLSTVSSSTSLPLPGGVSPGTPVQDAERRGLPSPTVTLHLTLALLVAYDILVYTVVDNRAAREARQWLGAQFSPDGAPLDAMSTTWRIFNGADAERHMRACYRAWADAPNSAGGLWMHPVGMAPEMTAKLRVQQSRYRGRPDDILKWAKSAPAVFVCELSSANPIGPFAHFNDSNGDSNECDGVEDVWRKALEAEIEFALESPRSQLQGRAECELWRIRLQYGMRHRTGLVTLALSLRRTACATGGVPAADPGYVTLQIITMLVALAVLGASVLSLNRYTDVRARLVELLGRVGEPGPAAVYTSDSESCGRRPPVQPLNLAKLHRLRTSARGISLTLTDTTAPPRHGSTITAPSEAPDWELVRAGPGHLAAGHVASPAWLGATAAAAMAVIASRTLNLCEKMFPTASSVLPQTQMLLQGAAALLPFAVVAHDVNRNRRLGLFVSTLERGTPPAVVQLVGCLPLFLAFSCAATHLFGQHEAGFASFDSSFLLLFGVMNGDAVSDMFDAAERGGAQHAGGYFVGRLYMYTFCCLSMYCVVLTFLAIIEEAYFYAKADLLLDLEEGRRLGGVTGHQVVVFQARGSPETQR
eukprot:TRINITY_DN4708_c0_g1_i1.p1 TRINITY_DN4708_c0_g1~~TRINITY_DN4708_c0_g1_i1.p1  ORF type:complete len:682 (+),score=217.34 TRINITY_DN4708_c0_g1_i1:43-2046(+)